jgi:flagellar biosynthesis protein FliP
MSRMTILKIMILIGGLSASFAAPALAQPVGSGAAKNPTPDSISLPKNFNPSAIVEESLSPTKLSGTLQILLLMTILSLAPAILVMTTCFTRIIVVLALLRQAMATQQLPPSQVITGLALFMTFCVMTPTWQKINTDAIQPYVNPMPNAKPITGAQAWAAGRTHIRRFMINQLENAGNMEDVYLFVEFNSPGPDVLAKLRNNSLQWQDVSLAALIPAFVTSELKQAFIMGFYIYLPFLIIDMVIASLLMSMGMMMLPPVLISLPFKLLLFVLVDGWRLVVGSLMASFTNNIVT